MREWSVTMLVSGRVRIERVLAIDKRKAFIAARERAAPDAGGQPIRFLSADLVAPAPDPDQGLGASGGVGPRAGGEGPRAGALEGGDTATD